MDSAVLSIQKTGSCIYRNRFRKYCGLLALSLRRSVPPDGAASSVASFRHAIRPIAIAAGITTSRVAVMKFKRDPAEEIVPAERGKAVDSKVHQHGEYH